jgi:hypothetical protein
MVIVVVVAATATALLRWNSANSRAPSSMIRDMTWIQ